MSDAPVSQQQQSKKRKSSEVEEGKKQLTPATATSNSPGGTTTNGKKAVLSSNPAAAASNSKKPSSSTNKASHVTTTTASHHHHHDDNRDDTSAIHDDYKALTLSDIRNRIGPLCERVPRVPPQGLDPTNHHEIRQWAGQLQAVLEEFNLLVCCISTATYKWGTDRSGAADQHLALLSGELAASQDQIASTVTPRLTNVLAPVVDLVVDRVITTKTNAVISSDDNATITTNPAVLSDHGLKPIKGYDPSSFKTGREDQQHAIDAAADAAAALSNDAVVVEVKQNIFDRKFVDDDFLALCHTILSRNAPLLRQVVLSNFHKLRQCLGDYLEATQKDNYSESSRGFAY